MNKKTFDINKIKNMYFDNMYSISSIAKIMNTTRTTITKYMKEHGIIIDSTRKGQHPIKPLTKNQSEIMDGCLLGDGHLTKSKVNSSFVYSSSIRNHTKFVYDKFNDFRGNIKKRITFDKRTNKKYISYRYVTITNITFTDLRKKWYPNNIKIIPKDLKLTSLCCLYWYVGDGGIVQSYGRKKTLYLKLSTQCFSVKDIDNILLPQLKQFNAYRWRRLIFIPRKNIKEFLKYIGGCPFPEYQHKWNVFKYKNKNIEKNGIKSHKHLRDIIILKGKSNIKPYIIAKELSIDNSLVKYYLKKHGLFKPNIENHSLKKWVLIDPNGNVFKINNITTFSKKHNLSHKCLRDLAHGRSKYYMNWSCKLENVV